MSLLTDNPWPLMIIALAVAAGLVVMSRSSGKRWLLALAVGVALLAPVIWVVDQTVVTDREQVGQNLDELTSAVRANDADAAVAFVSLQAKDIKATVAGGLAMVKVDRVRITDIEIEMLVNNTRATTHFRANGEGHLKLGAGATHFSTRWLLTWQKEGGEWKVILAQRLNPITGDEIGPLSVGR